jgi:hypothetical protein
VANHEADDVQAKKELHGEEVLLVHCWVHIEDMEFKQLLQLLIVCFQRFHHGCLYRNSFRKIVEVAQQIQLGE